MESSNLQSIDEVVAEIMRIHSSLPTRPAIDEVEAAADLIRNVEREEQMRVEAIGRQSKGHNIPEELFSILQEMRRNFVCFHFKEQKRDALKLLDLESLHQLFDDFIQRASSCLPSLSSSNSSSISTTSLSKVTTGPSASTSGRFNSSASLNSDRETGRISERFARDDSYVKKPNSFYSDRSDGPSSIPQIVDSTLKPAVSSSGQDSAEKLSLIKLASLIEVSSKKGTRDLNLQNKLMDQIEWLPDSIGKLSSLMTLDLSENRIVALPATIGGLSSLTKLDLHANRIAELPETVGDLLCLIHLDLRGNQLTNLPPTFGRLVRLETLDLSSNHLSLLPESIGSLISLKKLDVETNNIEEIPHTIGQCSSLTELRADYNRLKALPEAVGRIESLEVLSVRYNNIKQLPTTMASLSNLRELDVSFNELESVPESLCFATSLVKMNIGNNFADLQALPRSIGNLEMLEELDISNNQIRVLPDSFRLLSRLRVLCIQGNPLEVPPRHIAEKGAQAVVQYMAELLEKRHIKSQPVKQKKKWTNMCFFSRSNKRKRDAIDYVKT